MRPLYFLVPHQNKETQWDARKSQIMTFKKLNYGHFKGTNSKFKHLWSHESITVQIKQRLWIPVYSQSHA